MDGLSDTATESGGCLCGATRFRLDEPPHHSFVCHCATCRRATGGMRVAWVTAKSANLHFFGAAPKVFQSSPGIERRFCALCGTSLTWQDSEAAHEIDITLASFDHPENFPPCAEIWTTHRFDWDRADERLTQWPQDIETDG
jgi:hypothetical protein